MAGSYIEPQTPIMQGRDFYYPQTTAKQVILHDDRRLGGQEGLNLYADDIGALSVDISNSNETNADTLNGVFSDEYVLKAELDPYKTEILNKVNLFVSESEIEINNLDLLVSESMDAIADLEEAVTADYLLKTDTAVDANKAFGYTLYELKTHMLNTAYPIGSIYASTVNTNPSTLFGGTWEQLKDRFVLGAGGGYTAGATGGAATHTLSINELPSHTHAIQGWWGVNDGSRGSIARYTNSSQSYEAGSIQYTGGGAAHNNMPPYLAVYMWKRVS